MEHDQPTYQGRIVTDPNILVGKPTIRGTRISVVLVLEHLAENPDLTDLFAAYPELRVEDIKACLAYGQAVAFKTSQPAPVTIPAQQFARYQKQVKERFFKAVDELQRLNADEDPDEVLRFVTQLVEAVRQEHYERERRSQRA